MNSQRWPYPRVIAHRGGGVLAPENTLAALRAGWQRGFRAAEFDVMLASDGVAVLMHDPEFGRTVPGSGQVARTPSALLQKMDAGSWFGPKFAEEPVPLFEDVLGFCRAHGIFMNIEIKPAPGHDERTGSVVAHLVARFCEETPELSPPPLLSSFSSTALESAQRAAPHLARGHLFGRVPKDWRSRLEALGCRAVHCDHRHLVQHEVDEISAAGFGVFCYTVNDPERARELLAWGVDAFCTDRIDLIGPDFGGRNLS